MRQINFLPEYVSEFYGKDIIAFGTGKVGRVAIPYICRDSKINILGASNSRVKEETHVEYLDTEIIVRPLSQWYALYPNATILITIFDQVYKEEAKDICEAAGFKDIMFLSFDFFCVISYAYINNCDQYLDSSYQLCKECVATTTSHILEAACLANEIRDLHTATFAEFKGCNRDKDVAVVGCGPTLNYYQPISGVKHIGVNNAYKKRDLKLDYLFITDYIEGNKQIFNEINSVECHKFFTKFTNDVLLNERYIPENISEKCNGRRFYVLEHNAPVHWDIMYYPLMFFKSTIFPAIHFALYTRPKRLYLVGCDCTVIKHFDGAKNAEDKFDYYSYYWKSGYKYLKRFVQTYCPDTEIISVNPVGLKGMFRDIYMEGYLETHPGTEKEYIEFI